MFKNTFNCGIAGNQVKDGIFFFQICSYRLKISCCWSWTCLHPPCFIWTLMELTWRGPSPQGWSSIFWMFRLEREAHRTRGWGNHSPGKKYSLFIFSCLQLPLWAYIYIQPVNSIWCFTVVYRYQSAQASSSSSFSSTMPTSASQSFSPSHRRRPSSASYLPLEDPADTSP